MKVGTEYFSLLDQPKNSLVAGGNAGADRIAYRQAGKPTSEPKREPEVGSSEGPQTLHLEYSTLRITFGLSIYAIKPVIDDRDLKVGEIFRGALPFVATMLLALAILVAFPPIATWLARL